MGCLEAHGEMLVETAEDEVVKEPQSVKANTELALRGFIYEGNAHKVEWSFDEGAAPVVVEGNEHQETTVTHDFEGNGPGNLEPIVKETVHTDNLADPVIEVTRKVKLLEIAPTHIKAPVNAEAPEGGSASFTASAAGGNMKIQWEVQAPGGSFKADTTDTGNTTGTLTVNPVTAAENGNKYRASFKNGKGGPVTSKEVTLTVGAGGTKAPEVTEQPKSVEAIEGAEATFKAAASGTPAPTVQWEESTNKGASFTGVTGATATTLKVANVKVAESGDEYRAVFKNSAGEQTTSAATLTVNAAPVVTEQPQSVEVAEGTETSFKAAASGAPAPTVKWEESTDKGVTFNEVPGATSTTLKVASAKLSESGDEYRAVFRNSVGEKTTSAATLTVTAKPVAPEVTEQPVSVEVLAGAEASFKAAASGTPVPTVQWEESTNKGASFSEVPGATANTLKIASTKVAESGDEYRAVFKNAAGEKTTNVATLTVKAAPEVTEQPKSEEVVEGAEASFKAAASGNPAPTVQWEESTNGGTSFSQVPGATSTTFKVASTKLSESGDEYRAVFKNSVGEKTTSAATLTVTAKPVAPQVTEQPVGVEVLAGAEATFKAVASGTPAPTVQWEESTNGGASFTPVTGATSTTLKIANAKVTENGDEYRAVFKNSAGEKTTNVATLIVKAAPEVTEQPKGEEVVEGAEASFKAAASGNPAPTVQWEESTDKGVTFKEMPGATTTTLKVASTKLSESGDEYRALFKNGVGEKTTSAATLTVVTKPVAPEVTEQPVSVEVLAGAEASFKAAASGTPVPTVQWEESTNGGASFGVVTGATSTTLKIAGTKVTENGDQFRAVFKNAAGEKTTNVATLTVKAAPEVTKQPLSVKVLEGAEAKLEAAASGVPAPTVQWEESTNGGTSFSLVAGATSTTLKIASAKLSESGDQYRALFKNSLGEKATSAATLTVEKLSSPLPQCSVGCSLPPSPPPPPPPPPGEGGVLPVREGSPEAKLMSKSFSVSSAGKLTVKVTCTGIDVKSCAGTITLRTLKAVSAATGGAKHKASILTLVTTSYSVAAGQSKVLTLRLASKARTVLERSHTLAAKATIIARDPEGGVRSAGSIVTLRLAKSNHR